MHQFPPDRLILMLDDESLEKFVREWVEHKAEYLSVQRFTGPGDMGRDVVGFLTKERHEGPWHNYQCKQYGRSLATEIGIVEVAKVLYYSHRGEFTAPTKFFFVAPRNVNRNLKRYISKPSEFKQELIRNWDKYCAQRISEGQRIELTFELKTFIEAWDFSTIQSISVDEILADPASKPVMISWFGIDPGPAPVGTAPPSIEARELAYIRQLLNAYGERESCTFQDPQDVKDHAEHGPHLNRQRERFFDADSFERFYRDNTMSTEIELLKHDIYHGVVEAHGAPYADSLARVDAVMSRAAIVNPSGVLAKYARVPVRQGICHHFANEGKLLWWK